MKERIRLKKSGCDKQLTQLQKRGLCAQIFNDWGMPLLTIIIIILTGFQIWTAISINNANKIYATDKT